MNAMEKSNEFSLYNKNKSGFANLLSKSGSTISREATVMTLVSILEVKDNYTREHSERVCMYAENIAKIMHLSEDMQEVICYGAMLHDIGKINIPEQLLLKPGKFTPNEFCLMKEHTLIGDKILFQFNFLNEERIIVRSHHERYDGSGYPDGLFKDNIPLAARILAVADVYDAMTSDRPYRKAINRISVLNELNRLKGKLFDADVVDALKLFIKSCDFFKCLQVS